MDEKSNGKFYEKSYEKLNEKFDEKFDEKFPVKSPNTKLVISCLGFHQLIYAYLWMRKKGKKRSCFFSYMRRNQGIKFCFENMKF